MGNLFSLEGKRIIVTGASSGIGRACAELAADLGASVVLVARRGDLLQDVCSKLPCPEKHLCIECDVSDDVSVEAMIKKAVSGGKLDGLVHSAGIGPAVPLAAYDKREASRVLEINYLSFLAIMQHCSKKKNINCGFSAVAISSTSALAGARGQCTYAGSKGALSACVRTLAIELVTKGVRVNAVCPSHIKTEMFDNVIGDVSDQATLGRIIERQPLGIGTPAQVAGPVCFLLSDASNFITGVNLPVDGGFMAQ